MVGVPSRLIDRQVTLLRVDRQLVSVITGRATETSAEGSFVSTEVFTRVFSRGN